MSNWNCVTQLLENEQPLSLGAYYSSLMQQNPRQLLNLLSYYKFAGKMIGSDKKVLDIQCQEGLGSWLLAKECGFCQGIDRDSQAIEVATKNFKDASVNFQVSDFFSKEEGEGSKTHGNLFDAVVNFGLLQHLNPTQAHLFFHLMNQTLSETGVAIIGTPNTKNHHLHPVEISPFFEYVFLFSAHDEIIHTGISSHAPYYIALCCKPQKL